MTDSMTFENPRFSLTILPKSAVVEINSESHSSHFHILLLITDVRDRWWGLLVVNGEDLRVYLILITKRPVEVGTYINFIIVIYQPCNGHVLLVAVSSAGPGKCV